MTDSYAIDHIITCCKALKGHLVWQQVAHSVLQSLWEEGRIKSTQYKTIKELISSGDLARHKNFNF